MSALTNHGKFVSLFDVLVAYRKEGVLKVSRSQLELASEFLTGRGVSKERKKAIKNAFTSLFKSTPLYSVHYELSCIEFEENGSWVRETVPTKEYASGLRKVIYEGHLKA